MPNDANDDNVNVEETPQEPGAEEQPQEPEAPDYEQIFKEQGIDLKDVDAARLREYQEYNTARGDTPHPDFIYRQGLHMLEQNLRNDEAYRQKYFDYLRDQAWAKSHFQQEQEEALEEGAADPELRRQLRQEFQESHDQQKARLDALEQEQQQRAMDTKNEEIRQTWDQWYGDAITALNVPNSEEYRDELYDVVMDGIYKKRYNGGDAGAFRAAVQKEHEKKQRMYQAAFGNQPRHPRLTKPGGRPAKPVQVTDATDIDKMIEEEGAKLEDLFASGIIQEPE